MSGLGGVLRAVRSRMALRSCDAVGPGAQVHGAPTIVNRGAIEIGRDFRLDALPAASHLVTGREGRIAIGDGVEIGHGASLLAEELVRIGDGARIGPFAVILDTALHETSSHHAAPRPRPVRVGARAVLGARVTLLPGAEVGEGARILAGSVVSRAIPAGAVAAGVPAAPLGSWTGWDCR